MSVDLFISLYKKVNWTIYKANIHVQVFYSGFDEMHSSF